MKAKKAAKQIKMTDAEIEEAIKRDKAWMDDMDSDEGIVVPKGALKNIFGDEDENKVEDARESDNEAEDDDDDSLGSSGVGGLLGAIVGGVGGVVLGGILGAVLLDD